MIVIKAHYDGKAIVPDEPIKLRKGQRIVVHVEVPRPRAKAKKSTKKLTKISLSEWFRDNVVHDDGLPADLAYQHDHYLYGTPKKPEPPQP